MQVWRVHVSLTHATTWHTRGAQPTLPFSLPWDQITYALWRVFILLYCPGEALSSGAFSLQRTNSVQPYPLFIYQIHRPRYDSWQRSRLRYLALGGNRSPTSACFSLLWPLHISLSFMHMISFCPFFLHIAILYSYTIMVLMGKLLHTTSPETWGKRGAVFVVVWNQHG